MSTKDNQVKSEKASLASFLKENNGVISALGIFAALTVLFGSIGPKPLASFLSFLCLSATVLIWFTLTEQVPKRKTIALEYFHMIVSAIAVLSAICWFSTMPPMCKAMFPVLLMVPVAGLWGACFRKIRQRSTIVESFSTFTTYVIVFGVAWPVSLLLSPLILKFVEELNK